MILTMVVITMQRISVGMRTRTMLIVMFVPITVMITLSGLDTCWETLVLLPQHPYTIYQYDIKQYIWLHSMTKHLAGVNGCGMNATIQ